MPPRSKHSRKGKKSWRQNIDTTEVDAFVEQQNVKGRQGPGVETLQDSELFFIDQAGAAPEAVAAAGIKKRRREKKLLRCQLVLQEAHKAQPVPLPPPRKKKKGAQVAVAPKWDNSSKSKTVREADADLQDSAAALVDVWSGMPDTSQPAKRPKHASSSQPTRSIIPAVEVDLPGCSYNPDPEQRQDAVAVLVAGEMKKLIQKELAPKAPPKLADSRLPVNELDLLLVDAEVEEEDEDADRRPSSNVNEGLRDGTGVGDASTSGDSLAKALVKVNDRKTKKDRNKQARRKQLEAEIQLRKILKRQRQELSQLSDLHRQLQEEEQQKQLRLERRQVVKREKAATAPPRLGRQKFEEEPVQVLLSDELTGSLRTISPCITLLRDRFKSLQKRGLVEPRKPVGHRQGRRKVEYETGARRDKAIAATNTVKEEVARLRKASKEMMANA